MSDKEFRRRKIASLIFIQAWRLKKRSKTNMSSVLLISWRSFKGTIKVRYSKVVGVSFGGRQTILSKLYTINDKQVALSLEREPDNLHDENAIRVIAIVNNLEHHIGYVPRLKAAYLAPMIDAGFEIVAFYDGVYKGTLYGLSFRYALLDPELIKKKAA